MQAHLKNNVNYKLYEKDYLDSAQEDMKQVQGDGQISQVWVCDDSTWRNTENTNNLFSVQNAQQIFSYSFICK